VQFRRTIRPPVVINIAPLVDVVFLLVIFFAVSTSFLDTAGLKLELPMSSSSATREADDVTVVLAADGSLSLQGERVDEAELGRRLGAELDQVEERIVVLRADKTTPHGDVVRIMDLIREAGAEGLTIGARSAAE